MEQHHTDTIENAKRHFEAQPEVLALLLAGSIAHGFADPASDVDILIVVPDDEYSARKTCGELLFFSQELSTYPDGYVDGKYVGPAYMRLVAERGSEPARFAFRDASVIFSRTDGIEELVRFASRFPIETKETNARRFYAQIHAWKWFFYEARKKNNRYLETTAVANFTLFCARAILTVNEMLYPYHKWVLRELANAPSKPAGLVDHLDLLLREPSPDLFESIVSEIKQLRDWGVGDWEWANYYLNDVETVWMRHEPHISEL